MNPEELSWAKQELLCAHIDRKNTIQWMSLLAIIQSIRDAASHIAGGGSDGKRLKSLLKSVQSLHFPEVKSAEERTAEDAKKILEREYKKGPLKIQALKYTKKRTRKKREPVLK